MNLFTQLYSHKIALGIELIDKLLKLGSLIEYFPENFTELPDLFDGKASVSIIKYLSDP